MGWYGLHTWSSRARELVYDIVIHSNSRYMSLNVCPNSECIPASMNLLPSNDSTVRLSVQCGWGCIAGSVLMLPLLAASHSLSQLPGLSPMPWRAEMVPTHLSVFSGCNDPAHTDLGCPGKGCMLCEKYPDPDCSVPDCV